MNIWECYICESPGLCEHREPELWVWLLQRSAFTVKDSIAPVEERVIVMPARTPPGMSPVHTNLRKAGLA